MYELYKNNVKGKRYRLFYKANQFNNIKVETPVGVTEEEETGEGLGQGGLDSGFLSAVNLNNGVDEAFEDSKNEASIATLKLGPMLYHDDIARIAESIRDAQAGLIKLEQVAESKLLNYNMDKTCFIIIGDKKAKKKLEDDLSSTPLTLYDTPLRRSECEKYLGWYISGKGLSNCAEATIRRRIGNVKKAIYEIKTIIEDSRCQVIGGITTALTIWERSVIPFLLYSSENWTDMMKKSMETLTNLQNIFLRTAFATSHSCPIPILLFDTATLGMKLRIMKRKLMYAFHLEHLPVTSLANQVWILQKTHGLPGLFQEVSEFMVELGLDNLTNYNKQQWKVAVNSAIDERNHNELLNTIKSYKKLSFADLSKETYEIKEYVKSLPLSKARTRMRIRSKMVKTVKFNFQSDPEFARDNWQCFCGMIDSQKHIEQTCELYEDLRLLHNLDTDEGLVDYFDAVLLRRQEDEHQEEPED